LGWLLVVHGKSGKNAILHQQHKINSIIKYVFLQLDTLWKIAMCTLKNFIYLHINKFKGDNHQKWKFPF
jgi:hypothetical protein